MAEKETLLRYLRRNRDDLLSKIEGLSDYDARRPMTATGTNLLGLIKHTASVEVGYFGEVFGRPFERPLPWFDDGAEPDADFWSPHDESTAEVIDLHHACAAHSDATIEALELDAPGYVPWWAEGNREVTLHQLLVHMVAERARHAGHADIIRELIDGAAGMRPGDGNMTSRNNEEWAAHVARIDDDARRASPGE